MELIVLAKTDLPNDKGKFSGVKEKFDCNKLLFVMDLEDIFSNSHTPYLSVTLSDFFFFSIM